MVAPPVRLEWARVLRRRAGADDPVRARELLEAARAGAQQLGLSGLLPGIDAPSAR